MMLKSTLCFLALCAAGAVASASQRPVIVKHEGTPTGEVKRVNGIDIYHAYAPSKSNDNVILFFTDIFGLQLVQNRLLADSLANAGYLVLLPDYFRGDPVPVNQTGFNMTQWRTKHTDADVTSVIDAAVKYANTELKAKKVGAVGYCFGGPYVVRQLATGKIVNAGFIAHPGAITDAEWNAIASPLTIAAAETDQSFNSSTRHKAEDVLLAKNATYQINLYAGTAHGFGVRVDLNNRRQVFAKESAFVQAVRWFDEWLKNGTTAAGKKFAANGHWQGHSKADLRVGHDFENSF